MLLDLPEPAGQASGVCLQLPCTAVFVLEFVYGCRVQLCSFWSFFLRLSCTAVFVLEFVYGCRVQLCSFWSLFTAVVYSCVRSGVVYGCRVQLCTGVYRCVVFC